MPVRRQDFTWRDLGGETLCLSEDGAMVHVLNEVGTFFWKLADGTRSVETILAAICEEYDVTCDVAKQDLVAFLGDLADKGLVEFRAASQ
jgi:hypothetical protein